LSRTPFFRQTSSQTPNDGHHTERTDEANLSSITKFIFNPARKKNGDRHEDKRKEGIGERFNGGAAAVGRRTNASVTPQVKNDAQHKEKEDKKK